MTTFGRIRQCGLIKALPSRLQQPFWRQGVECHHLSSQRNQPRPLQRNQRLTQLSRRFSLKQTLNVQRLDLNL